MLLPLRCDPIWKDYFVKENKQKATKVAALCKKMSIAAISYGLWFYDVIRITIETNSILVCVCVCGGGGGRGGGSWGMGKEKQAALTN